MEWKRNIHKRKKILLLQSSEYEESQKVNPLHARYHDSIHLNANEGLNLATIIYYHATVYI